MDAAVDRLHPSHNLGLSLLLHSAAIYGLDMQVPDYPGVRRPKLKELLFNSDLAKAYFQGSHLFVRTAWGLRNETQQLDRNEWQSALQPHPGQLLCEFAKHGVPLDERLTVEKRDFHIKDLLGDSIANFNLNDSQLEWIAIALILYLPPQKTWIDKFGNMYSFADLAEELSHRDVDPRRQPCYGIHRLEALSILLKVNETHRLLSSECRNRLHTYLADQTACVVLRHRVMTAVGRMLPCSRFHPRVATRPASAEDPLVFMIGFSSPVITRNGCCCCLATFSPPIRSLSAAAGFLLKALLAARDEDLVKYYCPYSHAAHSLLLLTAGERR